MELLQGGQALSGVDGRPTRIDSSDNATYSPPARESRGRNAPSYSVRVRETLITFASRPPNMTDLGAIDLERSVPTTELATKAGSVRIIVALEICLSP